MNVCSQRRCNIKGFDKKCKPEKPLASRYRCLHWRAAQCECSSGNYIFVRWCQKIREDSSFPRASVAGDVPSCSAWVHSNAPLYSIFRHCKFLHTARNQNGFDRDQLQYSEAAPPAWPLLTCSGPSPCPAVARILRLGAAAAVGWQRHRRQLFIMRCTRHDCAFGQCHCQYRLLHAAIDLLGPPHRCCLFGLV
jgi:hypothetical protein